MANSYVDIIKESYSHTLVGMVFDAYPVVVKAAHQAHQTITKERVAHVAISILLYEIHTNVWLTGLCLGFVFHKYTKIIANDVATAIESFQSPVEKLLLFGVGGFFTLHSQPGSILVASLYYSARWGALFRQNCQDRHEKHFPKTTE